NLNILGSIGDDKPGANRRVNKLGPGEIVFSGANTYFGLTDIKEGTLVAHNPMALGGSNPNPGKTVVEDGAALVLQTDLALETVELSGGGIVVNGHDTGALRNLSGNNIFTGTLVLNTDSTTGADSNKTLTIGPRP